MVEFTNFGKGQAYIVQATADKNDEVLSYVASELRARKVTETKIRKTLLAVGEIFANIVSYAYEKTGDLRIEIYVKNKMVYLQFIDRGYAYDPLAKDMPDIVLDADSRQIGGLGIYLTRKMVDSISYERCDDLNVLTIGIQKDE